LVAILEAKNNFWLALGENGRCGEISFYGTVSIAAILTIFEGNQEVHNYFLFCSNKTMSESYNFVIIKQVGALLKLYASEKYILMVNQQPEDLRFYVSFKVCFKFPCEK